MQSGRLMNLTICPLQLETRESWCLIHSKFRPEKHRRPCRACWSERGRLRCNAPAHAGGKGDARVGAQVCLPPHAASALCGQCHSPGEASLIEFKDLKCSLRGSTVLATTRASRKNLTKHKSLQGAQRQSSQKLGSSTLLAGILD